MKWRQVQRYPYYHILERQSREIEEIEKKRKEEEKRAWRARRSSETSYLAEKKYRKDVDAEIYEVTIWDVIGCIE
jgi:hypothetical protein